MVTVSVLRGPRWLGDNRIVTRALGIGTFVLVARRMSSPGEVVLLQLTCGVCNPSQRAHVEDNDWLWRGIRAACGMYA